MTGKVELRDDAGQLLGALFTAADARRIARAVRLDLHIADDDAARILDGGAQLFLVRYVLEQRKSPTSPAEIRRWAKEVEKTTRKLFNLLDQAGLPWLHIMARKDMPAEAQARAAQLLGELPTINAAYGVTWLRVVSQRLMQEYEKKRGRRSTSTVGLTAFVQFTAGAFWDLFDREPKVGSINETVGPDDADGGKQQFKGRDSYYIRFMKGTARHLAVRIERDNHEMAAALRRWTKGDTLGDKARSLPREHFAKKS